MRIHRHKTNDIPVAFQPEGPVQALTLALARRLPVGELPVEVSHDTTGRNGQKRAE